MRTLLSQRLLSRLLAYRHFTSVHTSYYSFQAPKPDLFSSSSLRSVCVASPFLRCRLECVEASEVLAVEKWDLPDVNVGVYGKVNSRVNTWHNVLLAMQMKTQALVTKRKQEIRGIISNEILVAVSFYKFANFPDHNCLRQLLKQLCEELPCGLPRCERPEMKLTVLHLHRNTVDLGQMYELSSELSFHLQVNLVEYDYSGYGQSLISDFVAHHLKMGESKSKRKATRLKARSSLQH
ncbi:hypothetical protein ACFX1Q_024906 [Malus domestica]